MAALVPGVGSQAHAKLQVRVGIHTGLVVAGEVGAGEQREARAIVGKTPNVAARLQGVAAPDTLVVSEATYRLVQGYFTFDELGTPPLKGISEPLRAYRVLAASGARYRLEANTQAGLTTLVGRERELGLLTDRWQLATEGAGQVVLLSGEAGIGKSRVVQALHERVSPMPHLWLEGRGLAHAQNSAFRPVIELLERTIPVAPTDPPSKGWEKLTEFVARSGLPANPALPLLAALLSIGPPEAADRLSLSPQAQRRTTMELLATLVAGAARSQPVLLAVEDLHWVDPSTLEWLGLLVEQARSLPVLVVLTARPEFQPPWAVRSHVTSLSLTRLSGAESERLVGAVAAGKALPPAVVEQVVAKADGVPLFIEELTKNLLESDVLEERAGGGGYDLAGPLPDIAIPATLHDSLTARLDRLATVKEVAQICAIIGREFGYDLLRAVAPFEEATLRHELSRLVDAELLFQQGEPPVARYSFKHALIQKEAYELCLRRKRVEYHRRIAETMEGRFPAVVAAQPELLAHHYAEAELYPSAIRHWGAAAARAMRSSAHAEAIDHLRSAIRRLDHLPASAARVETELNLRVMLAGPLAMTRGYAAEEVEALSTRSLQLCRLAGEAPQLFPLLTGLFKFYLVRGRLRTAHEVGEQVLSLARQQKDSAMLAEALCNLGAIKFYLGEFGESESLLEQSIPLCDEFCRSDRDAAHHWNWHNPSVAARGFLAWCKALRGRADDAVNLNDEAIALARQLDHPFSIAYALHFGAIIFHLRREPERAAPLVDEQLRIGTKQEFPFWAAGALARRGWVSHCRGCGDGADHMAAGVAAWRATGAELAVSYWMVELAELRIQDGHLAQARDALAEAAAHMEAQGEVLHEAEWHRLMGECALQAGQRSTAAPADAERHFLRGIEVARRQGARTLELRATVALSKLWLARGRRTDAGEVLAGALRSLTEGTSTGEVNEARALLNDCALAAT